MDFGKFWKISKLPFSRLRKGEENLFISPKNAWVSVTSIAVTGAFAPSFSMLKPRRPGSTKTQKQKPLKRATLLKRFRMPFFRNFITSSLNAVWQWHRGFPWIKKCRAGFLSWRFFWRSRAGPGTWCTGVLVSDACSTELFTLIRRTL